MTSISFCKFHGFGNDYIVIERDELDRVSDVPAFARLICHRHTGAGSDGIAILETSDHDRADYFCEIVNPDGSIAGFSGNGTRCAVAYLHYKKLWSRASLRLETRSGIKNYRLIETIADRSYKFEAEIGKPRFASDEIPVRTTSPTEMVVDHPVRVGDHEIRFSAVSVGNPVACIFVNNFEFNWRKLGPQLETHAIFPERANIVFVKVIDRGNMELRIWERGAGETSASGTCSSGAAVLAAAKGMTGRQVSVHSPGGTTEVLWRDDDEMLLTGTAELAYCGEWPE